MKALPLAVATCLLAGLAAYAQPQEPQPQPARVRPRPYATVEFPAAGVELPMLEGPLAIVEVRVNGQGPFRFGIDTGAAGGARISQSLVDKLGLPSAPGRPPSRPRPCAGCF